MGIYGKKVYKSKLWEPMGFCRQIPGGNLDWLIHLKNQKPPEENLCLELSKRR